MEILIIIVAFGLGILTGVCLAWWHMNREWKRNPYRFRTIVDGVITQRERNRK